VRELGVVLYIGSGVVAVLYLGLDRLRARGRLRLGDQTARAIELVYCALASTVWLSAHVLIWAG
jgi:hypothetical protein